MGDQNIAEAIALQKAKELAGVFKHNTDYGWPVVWKDEVGFQYRNLRSKVLLIDCRTDPRKFSSEEAKDFFSGQSFHGDRYQHFGQVPPKLLQDNFVPQGVPRTCDGRAAVNTDDLEQYWECTEHEGECEPLDAESDSGSVVPSEELT